MATNNSSGIQCESSTDTRTEHVFKLIAYSIILFGSLVGNVLVILVVVLNRHMRSVTNYLIVNMAVADLLLTAFNMPVTIKVIATRSIDWSVVLCKIIPFTQSVSVASSVLTLTAIAIDRFLAILYPLKRYVTFPVAYYMIAVVWIVSIAVNSPFLYAMKLVFNKKSKKNSCLEIWTPVFSQNSDKDFTVVLFVTFYVFPLSTMSVLYSFVIHNLLVRKFLEFKRPKISFTQRGPRKEFSTCYSQLWWSLPCVGCQCILHSSSHSLARKGFHADLRAPSRLWATFSVMPIAPLILPCMPYLTVTFGKASKTPCCAVVAATELHL